MGNNLWVTKDMKWMFHVGKGTYGASKGINTVRGVSALFNSTGWAGVTYYQNDSTTIDIRTALSNYYVLEIIFNQANNKMIVLCNDTQGSFGLADWNGATGFVPGIQPTHLFIFIKVGDTWKQRSIDSVGMTNVWNTYQSSVSGKTPPYKPFFSILPDYNQILNISYVYPAYSTERKAYQCTLTFGD
jgi:hypothetical protein